MCPSLMSLTQITFPYSTPSVSTPTGLEKFSRLAFNDDGTMGAFVVGSKEVVVFEIVERDGKIETRNIGKKIECLKEITVMRFCPERPAKSCNFFATGHVSGTILLWDAHSGNLVTKMIDHDRPITSLVFTSKKIGIIQLLSVALDGKIKVWDFEESSNFNMSQTKAHDKALHCIDWSDGGHIVATAGSGMSIYIYRFQNKIEEKLFEFKGHLSAIVDCKFAADATSLISASLDTRVNIWDCLTGQLRQTLCHAYPVPQFIFGQAQVRSIGVTRSGVSILTMTDDCKLQFWNPMKITPDVEKEADLPSRVSVPLLPLRIHSELTMELEDVKDSQSFTVCKGGKWIGVTSENHDYVRIYDQNFEMAKLTELCRNVVRKSIAFHNGIDQLSGVPEAVKDFLKYDHPRLRKYFEVV